MIQILLSVLLGISSLIEVLRAVETADGRICNFSGYFGCFQIVVNKVFI